MMTFAKPEEGAVFDLSARSKFRLRGADRLRYLNGQITKDLRKARVDAAIHACVLNAKGKTNADVFIASEDDAFVLDADSEVREALASRLERYIIADDVQIEDVTEQFALFHVLGPNVPVLSAPPRTVKTQRFGYPGVDFWVASGLRDAARQELLAQLPTCDRDCAETFRIERGIPRWGYELTEEIIPIEANLEEATVDYAKGCYIGQEVISRIKMSGQTNKRLCGLVSLDAVPLARGMRLMSDGKDAGWVTSTTYSSRLGKQIGLGFVKRGFQQPASCLLASAEGREAVRVTVAELPFI